ncbi:hypothetical protein [Endozoicomonas sp. 8E]|uniref:hypothetical protein n=1 Tax=Endozoicomonas sp. 8E TaxID=3035692 RepID=UPI00293927B0|nr:hypothetical protein [Endozoicomonas sp. 8E]WOG29543.1 hypothetical protein P6910_07805 [Endozoicomonas sp. 8E]
MTNARPNALSYAVAFAISSFITGTQAMVDRRLQTKSIDIPGSGQVEFTQGEVVVQPTLGRDQQPIPKSCTTTYPDQAQARAGYNVPSDGFTDVLSGIDGGVSTVDQFETDDDGVAQKYTKILKVGNEGIFKFTHSLAEKALVIEVRDGMTHQDAIGAVRAQSGDTQPLESLTKVANPEQLAGLLKGANERAGNLGEADNFVNLVTIEVDEVMVNGRTFMRLIASEDQLPEMKRLGQSLFVNDEILLAAAASAYTQVHVLGEKLQQEALNNLLSYQKPVGYVVHVEDNAQTYPVPSDYPKLEVTEASEDRIVFRGQKQNPADHAFVQSLYHPWEDVLGNAPEATAKVKIDKVRSYQYVIRSRQMAVLEELAALHNTELNEEALPILAYVDKLETLANYESLQQALTSAAPDGADEFELTAPHVKAAASVILVARIHNQLVKHFSFNPALRVLLSDEYFIHIVHVFIPVIKNMAGNFFGASREPGHFASKVKDDISRQIMESKLEKMKVREDELAQIKRQLKRATDTPNVSDKQKPLVQRLYQKVEDLLADHRAHIEGYKIRQQKHQQRFVSNIEDREAYNTRLAEKSGIDNQDDTLIPEDQLRLIKINSDGISKLMIARIHPKRKPEGDPLEESLAAIEHQLGIFQINEKDPGIRFQFIQNHLRHYEDQTHEVFREKMAIVEGQLGLVPKNEDDMEARHQTIHQAIQQHLRQQAVQVDQQHSQQQASRTDTEKEAETKARYATIAAHLNIEDFDGDADIDAQHERLLQKIEAMNDQKQLMLQEIKTMGAQQDALLDALLHKIETMQDQEDSEDSVPEARQNNLAEIFEIKLNEDSVEEDHNALDKTIHSVACHLADLKKELEEIRTSGHPKARSEALRKLTAVEIALKLDDLDNRDDLHYLRRALSEAIQKNIKELRQKAEEEALEILESVGESLNIKVSEGDDKAERLARIRSTLNSDDLTETTLEGLGNCLWREAAYEIKGEIVRELQGCLTFHVEEANERAIGEQSAILDAIEKQLNIDSSENSAAQERGKDFIAKLAEDLKLELKKDTSLDEQKEALRGKIQALREEAKEFHDNDVFRDRDNKIARQLNIKDCEEDDTALYQNILIQLKLRELEGEVLVAGQPDVDERIAAIENELDRQIARLEPDPQYVLDLKVARARQVIQEAENELATANQKIQEQVKVLDAIHSFMQQHSLKKQALEAAMGLAQSAVESGKAIPCLLSFDFDDEFAPIRLQSMAGDDLTFAQASRIVDVFRRLKTSFPGPPLGSLEDQSQNALEKVQTLVQKARNEIKKGPRQYDEAIHGMGKTAIHYIEHKPEDLKSFSEYFASCSASGNKIMTLLHEGLISKVELENYIKAVRGIDGYQTMDEFKHFLGYKHGVELTDFEAAVRMLSDRGVEKFIKSALTPVAATDPAGMKESVVGMKEYAAAVIANYVLDDIAFENGRRTAAFLTNIQETLTPYANTAGLSESDLIKTIHGTLMQADAAAVEQQLNNYWVKPSAFLVQAVTWYYSSYKPLLTTLTARQAGVLSLSNMSFLYLLDLTNRGDYLHRMLIPFQHWLEGYGVDLDRTGQYAYHGGIEQVSEVGGMVMPLGKAASSVILLQTGSMLFARQHNANPHRYRSISRLMPEIVKSMGSGQGVQVPLLHRATPQKVKTLASSTAGLVLGPVTTFGAYAHGLISGFTYAQTFGFALASGLTFDFFMNNNKMLTQWLGGPLGRSLDRINRWLGAGETDDEYVMRTDTASPQRFSEADGAYTDRVETNDMIHGWTRHENYLQFRERRDRTMKLFENGWEKYFRKNVPKWSFSHAESIPYSYTLGTPYDWQKSDDKRHNPQTKSTTIPTAVKAAMAGLEVKKFDLEDKNTHDEL